MIMEKYRIDKTKGLEFGLYSIGEHLLDPVYWKSFDRWRTHS